MARDFQQCDMWDQQRLRPACVYAQSDQSLCLWLEYSMNVKLQAEHYLEFLSLKGGGTGSSEYICQIAAFLEIPCHGSHVNIRTTRILQVNWITIREECSA